MKIERWNYTYIAACMEYDSPRTLTCFPHVQTFLVMARRTKEDTQATRAALLDAAERVFQERGVSRTTLAEIATEAGVTRGALYWHFKDKADLFNAMMERVILPLESDWKALQESQGDPLPIWRSHLQRALWRLVHDEQTRRVLQIATRDLDAQFVKCRIPASAEHAHIGSVRQQLLDNVLPEKSAAASHESFHRASSRSGTS